MTDYDHYEEAKFLIEELSGGPLKNYAIILQNSIDEGSTGTEIFMALRWNLDKLLKEVNCSDSIRVKVSRLREELDSALR
jgi:hypothetical protein